MANPRIDVVFGYSEPADRDRFLEMLTKSKAQVRVQPVQGGEEVLALVQNASLSEYARFQPSLVILDLPTRSAADLLREIKASPVFRKVPVVILGAGEDPVEIKDLYDQGAASYLPRPTTAAAFKKLFDSVIKYWFGTVQLPFTE